MPPNGFGNGGRDDLRRAMDDLRGWFGRSRRLLAILIASGLLVIVLIGSYYQVEADEAGLVTRFGRFVRITNPGAHGKLHFGIERVQKVSVER